MYSVLDYGLMAFDGVRMSAYARAIERAVKPGSVVLDLGSGTGVCALLAARAGAKHVYAIDPNPAIWIARDLAVENGFQDRISVFESRSFDVDLPEKVDVIVSDLRGQTPLNGAHLAAVTDARTRWLASGGVSIPLRDRLFTSVVESEDLYRLLRNGWESIGNLGFSTAAAQTSVLNSVHDDRRRSLPASAMLTSAEPWATVEYGNPEVGNPIFEGRVTLTPTRRGIAHGLAVWFETTLIDDISYATKPGQELAYARCFLPFLEGVPLTEAHRVDVSIRANASGDRWSWETQIHDRDGTSVAQFRQSSFLGMPTSPMALRRQTMSAKPTLSPRGERTRKLLCAMDGTREVRELIDSACGNSICETIANPSPQGLRAEHERLRDEVRETIQAFSR